MTTGVVIFILLGIACLAWGVYSLVTSYKKDSASIEERQDILHNKYSTDQNRFAARREEKVSKARTAEVTQLGTEVRSVTDMVQQRTELITARHTEEHAPERLDEARSLEKILSDNQQAVTQAASQEKLDPQTYTAIKLKQAQSDIEVDKFSKMKAEELKNTLEEMRERIRLAIIADYLTEHQKIQLIIEQADLLYTQIQGIQENPNLNEITKRRMINDREEFILG